MPLLDTDFHSASALEPVPVGTISLTVYAAGQAGGRLAVPMLVVLDEAANVCRWKNLPDLYSHYGSRGIPILSLFQSWAQGRVVFGREGMRKLWSASNVKLYLGGVAEADFLHELSELVGDYDKTTASVS
jgi:type IV secretory pathway TraG/TraD family ATPase VirD4